MTATELLAWRRACGIAAGKPTGWTQREAAAALEMTITNYVELERGRQTIRPAVAKLARLVAIEEAAKAEARRKFPNVNA